MISCTKARSTFFWCPRRALPCSSTARAARRTRVATLPLGYNDGVDWRLSNRGEVLVRGRRARIVGRVSMDTICLDITNIPAVAVGSKVVLWGEGLPVERIAEAAGTIPYELLCRLTPRVRRVDKHGSGSSGS